MAFSGRPHPFGGPTASTSAPAPSLFATPAAPQASFFTPKNSFPARALPPTEAQMKAQSRDFEWLETLPTLPLFSLPDPRRSNAQYGLDELSLPPSPEPEAPAISRSGRGAASVVDDTDEEDGHSGSRKARVKGLDVGRCQVMAIVNETDLVLAAPTTTPKSGPPSELRIFPLAKYKSRQAHQHKILRPIFRPPQHATKNGLRQRRSSTPQKGQPDHGLPNEGFVKLVANPTHRLLAIVGRFEVGVIVLPRRNWHDVSGADAETTPTRGEGSSSPKGNIIDTEAYPIGRRHHRCSSRGGPPSSPIVDVLWHPYGASGQVLLVLTYDGLVREYDLSSDVAEPSQTINLDSDDPLRHARPSPLERKKTQASAERARKQALTPRRATSIGLRNERTASATPPWKAIRDRASTPTRASFGLRALGTPPSAKQQGQDDEEGKEEGAGRGGSGMAAMCLGEGNGDWGSLTLYGLTRDGDVISVCPYLPVACEMPASIIRSLGYFVSNKLESSSHGSAPPSIRANLQHSLDYVQALIRQIPDSSVPPSKPDVHSDVDGGDTTASFAGADLEDEPVKLSPPSQMIGRPRRQGPFLMQPPPHELSDEEAKACDMRYLSYERHGDGDDEEVGTTLGALVLAYQGRIDVCLEVEKPEPAWHAASLLLAPDSVEAMQLRAVDPPSLLVYESIDLGLTSLVRVHPETATSLVLDSVYPDTLCVYNAFGAYLLSLGCWLDPLLDLVRGEEGKASGIRDLPSTEIVPLLNTSSSATVVPVQGFCSIGDPYLGYSILATTSQLQTAAIELPLRTGSSDATAQHEEQEARRKLLGSKPRLYKTLLAAKAFDFEKDTARGLRPADVHVAAPPSLAGKGAGVTVDALRATVQLTSEVGNCMCRIVEAANAAQDRHRLQLDEHARQLAELEKLRSSLGGSAARTKELGQRAEEVDARQKALVDRADGVLQALMNKATPELSKHERQWFEELERVSEQIKIGTTTLGGGFDDRLKRVKERVDHIVPDLRMLAERQNTPQRRGTPSRTGSPATPNRFGSSQIKTIEDKLAEETRMLEHATTKVDRLTKLLEVQKL